MVRIRLISSVILLLLPFYALAEDGHRLESDLVYKATFGRGSEVDALLKQGVDPDTKNGKGVPVMAIAANRKDLEGMPAVKALREGGGSVEVTDHDGQTPLFYAARRGNIDVVLYLMQQGAQYYRLDSHSEIARSYAYRAGYHETVKAMDDFVEAQQQAVAKQYEEYHRALIRNKELRQAMEEKRREEAAKRAQAKQEALQNQEKEPTINRSPERLQVLVQDMAFDMCAFQYWSYCQSVGQESDLKREDMKEAIAAYKQEVAELSRTVMADYAVDQKYVRKVIDPSQAWIAQQLARYRSPIHRRENGICAKGDAAQRCQHIAKSFEVNPSSPLEGERAKASP